MTRKRARKKRILYVQISPGTGGANINVFYPMVTGLDRDRYEPVVLFYWPDPFYGEQFEALGIKTIVFEKPRSRQHPALVAQLQKNRLVKNLQQGKNRNNALYHAIGSYVRLSYQIPQILRLAKHMKVNDVDLVHLTGDPSGHGREVVLAAKLAGLPLVCYAQNFSEFQAVDRQIARFIDRYVFCSNAIGEHCVRLGGAVPTRGCTIYPGVVDGGRWSRPYDTSKVRREIGWADKDFIVGNIGRLVSWKGQDVFLKALAEVKREVASIKGLVVGGPTGSPFYERLLALRESLNLTDNVHFTGYRSDIPQILASVDVFVHSSSDPEPFATAAIEAMMSGRPVIAINAGGMPEMIDDGVTGLLAPLNDPQAMAQAILFYYRDRARARQIAKAGQQKAKAQFTAQRNIDEFQALYQTLLT